MKLKLLLVPYTKGNSEWDIDLNGVTKTINLLEEIINSNLGDLGLGNGFLDMTPKTQPPPTITTKWVS